MRPSVLRVALGLPLLLVPALAWPGGALAGGVSKRDHGGVRANGLTRAQRRALDIDRVSAVGGSFGLAVTVRFKGNIRSAIGRGRLKRSVVALVLRPKRGAGRPSVLAISGRGKGARTLRRTRSNDVEAVALGKEVRFYVLGAGLSVVRRLQVKTFARLGPAARTADTEVILDKDLYDKIVNSDGADKIDLPPPFAAEVCKTLLAQIRTLVKNGQGSATTELAASLLAHGCVGNLELKSIGYEHVAPGKSRVCADLQLDPALIPGLANFAVVLRDSAGKIVDRRYFRDDFDASGKLRAIFEITQGGNYTFDADEDTVEDEEEVGTRHIRTQVVVVPPPAASTKDCTP